MEKTIPLIRKVFLLFLAFFLIAISGCATFGPLPMKTVPFKEREITKGDDEVQVTTVPLSIEESEQVFGTPLAKKGIQPVWVKIENNSKDPFWLLTISIDPNYFAPLEASRKSHFFMSGKANKEMDTFFQEQQIPMFIPPKGTSAGFVYTHLDQGAKYFRVDLLGEKKLKHFDFFHKIPDFKGDWLSVDFDRLYKKEDLQSCDEKGLYKALEGLPCCTTDKKGTDLGDPINLILIAKKNYGWQPFIRRGWHLTETMSVEASWKTVKAFIFGSKFGYTPVSPLYVFGRHQDIALQKVRSSVNQRNHLRLWLSPMRFQDKRVWAGQISRDIGVRITTKSPTLTTHKIDPNIDEARTYLLQDLLFSKNVKIIAYTEGVGEAPEESPRKNLTGDPYFTDGLRLVLFLSDEETDLDNIKILKWAETPAQRQQEAASP
jgi:hypothetical protein